MKMNFSLLLLFLSVTAYAQFAPQVGQVGTTAIPADSPLFVNWAQTCEAERGLLDIADSESPQAGAGSAVAATGASDGTTVSLGDGGTAVLTFDPPIRDGEGFDFAVFENGFLSPQGDFLELAFVEVSSNGTDFFRFPAVSLTPDTASIGSFGILAAAHLHNLAGKYYGGYGTPFDLSDLAESPDLDTENITRVRVRDVIGTADTEFASFDSEGNVVIDPYPTAFPAGGFDLDAVGVLNQAGETAAKDRETDSHFTVYPNPVRCGEYLTVQAEGEVIEGLYLWDTAGSLRAKCEGNGLEVESLGAGVYLLEIIMKGQVGAVSKVILR